MRRVLIGVMAASLIVSGCSRVSQEDLDAAQAEADAAEERAADEREAADDLESDLEDAMARITELEEELGSAQEQSREAQQTNEALQDRLDSVEAEIAEAEAAAAEQERPGGAGGRDNPVPVGTAARVGEYDLTVVEVNLDAAAAVAAENQFNDPPADGRQFVMATIQATYNGNDEGIPWLDLNLETVGASQVIYGGSSDSRCGVLPESLQDQGNVFEGGTITGNECWSVVTDDIGSLVMAASSGFGGERTFFALSGDGAPSDAEA